MSSVIYSVFNKLDVFNSRAYESHTDVKLCVLSLLFKHCDAEKTNCYNSSLHQGQIGLETNFTLIEMMYGTTFEYLVFRGD